MDKNKTWKLVRNTPIERRKVSLLRDEIKIKIMGTFQGWDYNGSDMVCVKKKWRRSKADTWWWNEEVKEAI